MQEISASRLTIEQAREAVKAAEDVTSALHALCTVYQLDNATYYVMQNTVSTVDSPFVRTTYPVEWVGKYLTKGYAAIDPVVQKVMQGHQPFDWSELAWTGAARAMLCDAEAFGVGGFGYSIPLVDESRGKAVLSLNAASTPSVWAALVDGCATEWSELAVDIHDLAMREAYGSVEDFRPLARRERQCLALAAQGKSYKEISLLLSISDYTARGHLTSARLKLKCRNTVHAVAKATKLRIIDPI
jgi:DNA-binding CsgD family transcriptional regulator